MCAAILCARKGFRVTILEKNKMMGKKLSITGNGRCNISHNDLSANDYNPSAAPYMEGLLKRAGLSETISFFQSIGTLLRDEEGYWYPYSGQASAVVQALQNEISALNIEVLYETQVKEIIPEEVGYTVRTLKGRYPADQVILATGGIAGPKNTLSTGDGYYMGTKLGASVIQPISALVPLVSNAGFLPKENGIRTLAKVQILIDGKPVREELGEVQITAKGISGIPVLQVSASVHEAINAGKTVKAELDFLPDMEKAADVMAQIFTACNGRRTLGEVLDGIQNHHIGAMVLQALQLDPNVDACLVTPDVQKQITAKYKHFEIPITGVGEDVQGQTTRGGIALQDLTEELELKSTKGVYVIGELADVDGRCGGYNLQWAWTSAHIAAWSIIKKYDQNQSD